MKRIVKMKKQGEIIREYGVYTLAFLVSYIASCAGLYYLSGLVLMAEAVCLYVHWSKEDGNLTELRALFTLAWVGGQGIACLKLSRLQTDWHYMTWIAFCLIYLGFGIGYEWGQQYGKVEEVELKKDDVLSGRLFLCIVMLAVVSVLCFLLKRRWGMIFRCL